MHIFLWPVIILIKAWCYSTHCTCFCNLSRRAAHGCCFIPLEKLGVILLFVGVPSPLNVMSLLMGVLSILVLASQLSYKFSHMAACRDHHRCNSYLFHCCSLRLIQRRSPPICLTRYDIQQDVRLFQGRWLRSMLQHDSLSFRFNPMRQHSLSMHPCGRGNSAISDA